MTCADSMFQDDLEDIALKATREHYRDTSQEDTADGIMLFADGLLYAVAISSLWIAISAIDNDNFVIKEWNWSQIDLILVISAIGLWVCSQSLNDFKRLLPLWLKLALKMKVLPTEFVEQSEETKRRKIFSIYFAVILGIICAWRVYSLDSTIEARIGVPFHFVILGLALLLFLTGKYWSHLMKKEIKIKTV